MAATDRPFVVGVPWGISDSTWAWPGTTPQHKIFHETGMSIQRTRPLRFESEIGTVQTTRVLPNGVRIDKFQGYRAPITTSIETWRWAVRSPVAQSIASDYSGIDLAQRYTHGMIVGLYLLEILDVPPTSAQRWTAQARWEVLRVDNEPGFMAGYAIYTATFARLTEWNFINGLVTIS